MPPQCLHDHRRREKDGALPLQFEIRRTPDSDNDFTNVFSLMDAANSYGTPNYVAQHGKHGRHGKLDARVRRQPRRRAIGIRFGAQNGQNLYGYIGTLGTKYSLLMWDFNIVIGNGALGAGTESFHRQRPGSLHRGHLQQPDLPAHVLARVAGTGQRTAQCRQQRPADRRQIQRLHRQWPERRKSQRQHRTLALPRRKPASPRNWPPSMPPISPSIPA